MSSMLEVVVRVNEILPDIETLGDENKSEWAAEVKRLGITANTSCSIFALDKKIRKLKRTL